MEHDVIPAGERHGPNQWEAADQAARLALTTTSANVGQTCWQKSDNTLWICTAANTWAQLGASGGGGGAVSSVAGKTGVVTLVPGDVGLGNVNNTADSAKPVSTAQQTALNLKANLASPTFTGPVGGITAAMVGLGNVNNTADSAKPISTATQAALDLKTTAPTAQTPRTGASTAALSDKNTLIQFSAAATYTVPSGLTPDPLFTVEGVRTGSGAVTLARGAGTVLMFGGADVASVTLDADGQRFALMGSSVANKYYAYKIGA